ncbi:MAG: LamG domain-containing protein [Bacteroidaceae bacterium]
MKRESALRSCLTAILLVAGTMARALDLVDGVYQIGNLEDYKAFAAMVNEGANTANAVLTADIDLGEDATMIGTASDKPYSGVFDGQGHTISIAWKDAVYDCGIFQYMAGTARNLYVTGSLQSVNQHPSTVVGRTHSNGGTLIENIYCDVEMNITKGYDTGGGGIIAFAEGSYKMKNVIFAGKMIGNDITEHCGGFVGWSTGSGEISNCLFVGEVTGIAFNSLNSFNYVSRGANASWNNVYFVPVGTPFATPNVIEVSAEDVASGALAFALNNNEQGGTDFYQTIGIDAAPVPFANGHSPVYCIADSWLCDGSPLGNKQYTNEPQEKSQPAHEMEEGFCNICGSWDETYMSPAADGWYEIENGYQLAWWASLTKKDQFANMRLTADIEMDEIANSRYVAPGTATMPFCGHIDGQHHCISGFDLIDNVNPAGLISVMSSQIEKSQDEEAARSGEPAYIKNLRLDETCTITGNTHVAGFVGQLREWPGNVLLENVGMEGTVNGMEGGKNCGGLIGCAPGQATACSITIRNSYVTGNIHGMLEDGLLAGWLGYNSLVENCYAIGECDAPRGEDSYLTAPVSNVTLKNVFSMYGTQGNPVTQEEVNNGALCVNLIGNDYTHIGWFQTIGEDDYPVNNPTHAIVVMAGEEYICFTSDAEVQDVVSSIQTTEYEYLDEVMAEQRLIDDCRALAQALSSISTIVDFKTAYTAMLQMRDTVIISSEVYASYVAKCHEVSTYLDEHNDFTGPERNALEEYLQSNAAPSKDWPLGGYVYITENHLAADSLIYKEIDRVQNMLNIAIAGGYQPGMDVTSLLTNPDLSDGTNGWEGTEMSTWSQQVQENTWYVGENYSADSVNFSQTITGIKPGYYLLTMNAASKANGNRYSYDHHALLYANNNTAVIPVVLEDMQPKETAIDGVNCAITGNYTDHVIYDDGFSTTKTEENDTLGFIPPGLATMAFAMNGSRYKVSVLTKVGNDNTLTIGLRRNASNGLTFQMLFGNAQLTYCGTETDTPATTAIETVLKGQMSRANTILSLYNPSDDNQKPARNFPQVLREQLQTNVNAAKEATGFAAQHEALTQLSTTLEQIIEGKEAYYAMYKKAEMVENIAMLLSASFTETESNEVYDAIDAIYLAYEEGSYTTEEARKAEALNVESILNMLPKQDENGVYQIENPRQMLAFASYANADNTLSAVVCGDLDMTGLSWVPIGTSGRPFRGTFDGLGHRFSNFQITATENYSGMFGYVGDGAIIRNFVLDNTCTIDGTSYVGVIGGNNVAGTVVVECVGMEGNVTGTGANVSGLYGVNMGSSGNIYITNCYVTGTIAGGRESAALCGWGGGSKGTFTNCWTNSEVSGYYFADGQDYIIRNTSTVMKHVFSVNGAQGTIITPEDLASGAICYILNEGNTTNPKWYQTLGTDPWPVLDSTHGVVGMTADSTFTNQASDWMSAPELILDIAYNEDGTAYDASPMKMQVETIGEPSAYYNEELKRNVARFDNEWGAGPANYYKVDFEPNMLFRSGLENSHTLEMLLMADYADVPTAVAKPFSAMQIGGTGFETAIVDDMLQFRFNPNASPLYISSWARCDSKVTIENGVFYHVVGIWDKESAEASIYVNGELCSTVDLPGYVVFPTVGSNWFGIGGDPAGATKASNAWRGDIAIARVYSTALSPERISTLYKDCSTGITNTEADSNVKSTGIYTINGIRVQKTEKGLYIINGKKVLVK